MNKTNYNTSTNADCDILFIGKKDRYNGVFVSSKREQSINEDHFSKKLTNSLQKWKEENIRGVWFDIGLEHSKYIHILVENNFIFHHASYDGRLITMHSWLPKDEPCAIPGFAHTMIGVGAIVVNDNNQILVVKEKYLTYIWKLPGGYVEPNEELDEAAKREVLEETGILTEFKSLIMFRHMHKIKFQCSDIYFITELKPISSEIKKCDYEIHDSKWIDINEFLNHSEVTEINKGIIRTYLENKKCGVEMKKSEGIHPLVNKPYSIYFIDSQKQCTLNKNNNDDCTHGKL